MSSDGSPFPRLYVIPFSRRQKCDWGVKVSCVVLNKLYSLQLMHSHADIECSLRLSLTHTHTHGRERKEKEVQLKKRGETGGEVGWEINLKYKYRTETYVVNQFEKRYELCNIP